MKLCVALAALVPCLNFGMWLAMEQVGNPDLSCEGEGEGWLPAGSFVPTGLGTRGILRELLLPSYSPPFLEAFGLVSQQQARWCCSVSTYVNADLSMDSSLGWIKPCMIAALVHFKTVLVYIWIPMGALGMS